MLGYAVMKIATWNVNSVRARMPNILTWLKTSSPDIVLFQEIKCETSAFPAFEFEALGYKSHALGQKSYNGVAILSRFPIEDTLEHLPENENDPQSRYLEATIQGLRVASLYLPNGNPVTLDPFQSPVQFSDKYLYKLVWMERFQKHAAQLLNKEHPIIFGGDYNIIPEAIDVYDPKGWELDALYYSNSRAAYRSLINLGFTEAFRTLYPHQKNSFTFWDYQAGAWPKDNGLRIDHFLLSPEAADRMITCIIDRTPRGEEKASDHTPVLLELQI